MKILKMILNLVVTTRRSLENPFEFLWKFCVHQLQLQKRPGKVIVSIGVHPFNIEDNFRICLLFHFKVFNSSWFSAVWFKCDGYWSKGTSEIRE
jgi:hypothetical protein